MDGSSTCPWASIRQGLKSFRSYFQSKWSGRMRTIRPFLTSTTEVLASPLLGEEMKLRPLMQERSSAAVARSLLVCHCGSPFSAGCNRLRIVLNLLTCK